MESLSLKNLFDPGPSSCPGCLAENVFLDASEASHVCESCGLIIQNRLPSLVPPYSEWTTRTADAPANCSILLSSTRRAKEDVRNTRQILSRMHCGMVEGGSWVEDALSVLSKCHEAGFQRRFSSEELSLGCVLASGGCTWDEMNSKCVNWRLSVAKIRRCVLDIRTMRADGLTQKQRMAAHMESEAFTVESLAKRLGMVRIRPVQDAISLVKELRQMGCSHESKTVAAATLYHAGLKMGQSDWSMKSVSVKGGVSEGAVRKCYTTYVLPWCSNREDRKSVPRKRKRVVKRKRKRRKAEESFEVDGHRVKIEADANDWLLVSQVDVKKEEKKKKTKVDRRLDWDWTVVKQEGE